MQKQVLLNHSMLYQRLAKSSKKPSMKQ